MLEQRGRQQVAGDEGSGVECDSGKCRWCKNSGDARARARTHTHTLSGFASTQTYTLSSHASSAPLSSHH